MKSPSPVVKNKEADDIHIDFKDVNYTSLPNGIKSNDEYTRRYSVESVHNLNGLKPTTYFETLTHLVKCNVGCGVLGLGMAFKNGGLLLSVATILLFSFMSGYNQYILIKMANDFKRKYNRPSISYSDTIGIAFENGPPVFKKLSSFIRKSINFIIITTQLGACSVYIIFISQSLNQLLACYNIPEIDIHILMVGVLPFVWLTALIRQLKYLAPLSTVANVSILAALAVILRASLMNLKPLSEIRMVGRWEDLPLGLGAMVFAMEGICLTLPLEQNMKNKQQFLGLFGVLNVSLTLCCTLMCCFGFFAYWTFGETVADSLTSNLNLKESLLSQAVIVAMMIGILCTYAIQFFVPVVLILPKIDNHSSKWPNSSCHIYEYILRSSLVLITFAMSEIIPHFNLFSSLMGAIGGTFLGFIFCPMADLLSRRKEDHGKCYWTLILAVFSLTVGFLVFIFGTTVSSKAIYNKIYTDLHKL